MTLRSQREYLSVVLVLFLLFLHVVSCTEYFKIFRRHSGQLGSQRDSFQTPQSLCGTASTYSCLDYGSQHTTCSSCTCPSSNSTFGFMNDKWKCIGKRELRYDTGCSIKVKGELQSQPLLLVQSRRRYYIDLPMDQSCSYDYAKDTYYRTCNGTWSAAGYIGSGSRYVMDVIKRQNRYRYWLNVKSDSQAVNVLQGRMVKLNITCSKGGSSLPWSQCFLFKEPYFNRPISCPIYSKASTTIKPTPSIMSPSDSATSSQTVQSTENSVTSSQTVQSTENSVTSSQTVQSTENSVTSSQTVQSTENSVTSSQTVQSTENSATSSQTVQSTENSVTSSQTVQSTENSVTSSQTVQSTENSSTSDLFTTSKFLEVRTTAAPNATHPYPADKDAQSGVDKKTVISVSVAVGALLVVIATVICIVVCCKRRKRNSAARYTAALYNASQDQCYAGTYEEAHITLPSALKSASLMSHSNPAYGRGQDFSITVKTSRHGSSPPRLEHHEPDSIEDSKIIENENMFTNVPPSQPIKGRRNMIVAYENVIILSDTSRVSVPDAEAFYDNPGSNTPSHYHVLENPEEVSGYASFPLGSHNDEHTQEDPKHYSLSQNSYDEANEEPIYINSPASPVSPAGNTRDSNFSFEESEANYNTNEGFDASSFDGAVALDDNWDIYANPEATRSSYVEENSINNRGYVPDDEEVNNQDISTDEPIYDNQIDMDDRVNGHSKPGDPPVHY